MDRFMNIIVKLVVFFSRFAPGLSKMGFIDYRSLEDLENDPTLHILLVGYNGARNTGADVRVAEIARQLQEGLGKDKVELSAMTLDAESMRCYFDPDVHLIQVRSIFFGGVFKACCANQAAILCEGSTLKSKFANALTLYSCEAAGIMRNQHKPCIAYGSEAGEMDAFLERTVRRLCKDTYFIARTQNSLDYIQKMGLTGHLGTDTAWGFDSSSYEKWAVTELKQSGWDGASPLLGVAPINPFWWPVKPSLIKWLRANFSGDHSLQFQLWYFFSWSAHRKQQFEDYLDALALSVNEFAKKHPCHVVILGMEQLDTDAVSRLTSKLEVQASAFLSSDHDGYQMAALLRQLTWLITSRYHAEVLSTDGKVPSVAISMDERLDNIMKEMDMGCHQLLHADDTDLSVELPDALEFIRSHPEEIKENIGCQLERHQSKFDEMGDFLIQWLHSHGEAVR